MNLRPVKTEYNPKYPAKTAKNGVPKETRWIKEREILSGTGKTLY